MTNRIEVKTVFGKLTAEVSGDPDHPGISLCIEEKEEDEIYIKTLAVAECTSKMPTESEHSLRLLVYNSDNNDDWTNDFTFIEGTGEMCPADKKLFYYEVHIFLGRNDGYSRFFKSENLFFDEDDIINEAVIVMPDINCDIDMCDYAKEITEEEFIEWTKR